MLPSSESSNKLGSILISENGWNGNNENDGNNENNGKMKQYEETGLEVSPGSPNLYTKDVEQMMRGVSLDGGPRQGI
jgi:hypothetical protein